MVFYPQVASSQEYKFGCKKTMHTYKLLQCVDKEVERNTNKIFGEKVKVMPVE
jgi:hypothetical protein